jgi:hypothetical protein
MYKIQLHFSGAIIRTILFTLMVALFTLTIIQSAFAQPQPPPAATDNPWTGMDRLPDNHPAAAVWIRAQNHKAVDLDHVKLRKLLDGAPNETAHAGWHHRQISFR